MAAIAADESGPTIGMRFKTIGVESSEESRRAWRSLIQGAPGLGEFVSGIILHEETLGQCADDGTPLPDPLLKRARLNSAACEGRYSVAMEAAGQAS